MRRAATVVGAWLCCHAAAGGAQGVLVVRSATVLDGRAWSPRESTTVVVRGGRIVTVGPDAKVLVPPGTRVIDARGRWLVPGFIEVHTHTTAPSALKRALALGVTSALVIGVSDTVLHLEGWSADPVNPSPRLYVTPGGFTGEFPDNVFPGLIRLARPKSQAAARREVELLRSRGATHLKIWQDNGRLWWDTPRPLRTLAPEVLREIVRAAHARSMRVYVHAWQMRYARDAVAAGVDALIHPIVDSLADAALLKTLSRRHMPWVLTISGGLDAFNNPASYTRRVLADPRLASTLSPAELAGLPRDTVPLAAAARLGRNHHSYRDVLVRNTLSARRAGVPIAVGSDAPIGLGTHIEMELMVEAGLSPSEVLAAASAGGALVLGVEREVGTIEVGKRADLVVLRSDPLRDIRNARDVEWTIKDGLCFRLGEPVPCGHDQ